MNKLFVTGMFRSGTTLTAKMFDAHQEVAFASDPYRPFFNFLRDQVLRKQKKNSDITPQTPLHDYFDSEQQLAVMKGIQNIDLDEELDSRELCRLLPVLAKRSFEFSPKVSERTETELSGTTYRELIASMDRLILECYGKRGACVVGQKEVWTTEFSPVLLKAYPEMKVINITRDPRSVCASNNVTEAKYPWLFLIRQWRKLAILDWLYQRDNFMKDRFLSIRYEDLVAKPEETAKKMCAHVGIEYDPDMIDGSKFRNGHGARWQQNSSYGGGSSINTQSSEKWKNVLTSQEVMLIEKLTYFEMKEFGYEPILAKNPELEESMIENPIVLKEEELADWIKKYSELTHEGNVAMMKQERKRVDLLGQEKVAELEKERFYLSSSYFDFLQLKWIVNKTGFPPNYGEYKSKLGPTWTRNGRHHHL